MLPEILAVVFVFILFIFSFICYRSKSGKVAVYTSWYAWIIDFLALLSGTYISIISFFLYYNNFSLYLIIPLFIAGSTQAVLHIAKFLVRITSQ